MDIWVDGSREIAWCLAPGHDEALRCFEQAQAVEEAVSGSSGDPVGRWSLAGLRVWVGGGGVET